MNLFSKIGTICLYVSAIPAVFFHEMGHVLGIITTKYLYGFKEKLWIKVTIELPIGQQPFADLSNRVPPLIDGTTSSNLYFELSRTKHLKTTQQFIRWNAACGPLVSILACFIYTGACIFLYYHTKINLTTVTFLLIVSATWLYSQFASIRRGGPTSDRHHFQYPDQFEPFDPCKQE